MVFFRINTDDFNGRIQFVGYRVVALFFFRSVSAEFQAVVQGSNRFVINDQAGNRFAVLTVYARFTLAGNGDGLDLAVFTLHTDRARCTGFARGAVLAVDYNRVNIDVSGQGNLYRVRSVFRLVN